MIPGMRRKYLRIRSAILQNRYNVNFDMQSNSACSQSTSLVSTEYRYDLLSSQRNVM